MNKLLNKLVLNTSLSILLAGFITLHSAAAFAEIAVVVGSGSSISATDANEIQRLYLGKSKTLGGVDATPLNQSKGDTLDAFNKAALNKSSSQIKAYWSKLVFTGKGTPPKEVGSDADVIAAVSSDTSAVGYIDASAVTGDVKVLLSF